MKILHLSTEDITGGAARAAYRLHTGLRRMGHDSSMYVVSRRSKDPHVTAFDASMEWSNRIRRRYRREQIAWDFARYNTSRPDGFEIFSDDRSEFGGDLVKQLPPCDVLNLHWIARYVDYEAFFSSVPKRTPVVWRIADMNPITGGCHVDEGCGRFLSGCGSCPQLGSGQPDDLSSQVWKRKQKTFHDVDARRLHLVTLNRWMTSNVAQHPFLQKFPVSIIPNGIDTELFAPRDRKFAREVLGLPQDAVIVLFVADVIQVRYKGFALLTEALSGLGDQHDLFVVPALYDNSPNTILEAMACGIPVVAFETGGIPDMVRQGITGLLAPRQDVAALRASMKDLIQHPDKRQAMGAQSREIALQEYTLSLQTRRYAELYKSLL